MPKAKRQPKPHPWCERLRWFPCPHFTLCLNEAQFARVVKHLRTRANDVPDFVSAGANATTHFFECNGGNDVTAVVTLGSTKGRAPATVTSLLVHEAMHIWRECLKSAGEKHPSSEFEAYAMQHLTHELLKMYARLKRR